MQTRPVVLAILAATGLAACIPSLPGFPDVQEAAPLTAADFSDVAPLPAGAPTPVATPSALPTPASPLPAPVAAPVMGPASSDPAPFTDNRFSDIATKSRFAPKFSFAFDAISVNAQPAITLDIYQTAEELEVKEIRALIERSTFRYDRLKVGMQVGSGQMDVGTPPKASATIKIVCTDTDAKTYGVFTAKATHPLVNVYLSDIKIKDNDGNLSLVSISNFARGNDHVGRRTTERSARIQQRFDPELLLLSSVPGELRSRVLIYSEGDPKQNDDQAMRLIRQSIYLTP